MGIAKEMPWKESAEYAESLGDGWRVPAVEELESLLDRSLCNPVVRKDVPFRDSSYYWSSTTYASATDHAWRVYFHSGNVGYYYKSGSYYVRCVRGLKK